MWLKRETKFAIGFAVVAAFAMSGSQSFAQGAPDANAAPNPYKLDEGWLKMPEGRKIGATFGLSIDRDGKSLWAFDRCASADFCAGTNLNPIFKFDTSGKVLANFGAGMFASPHGLYADRDGNVWATDFRDKDGKGHTVTKFSPDGKVLMTLGKAGVKGDGQDTFNAPSNVLVAPNGDIFVADGHGGDTNARIVKLTKEGKFIKAWGKKGTGPGEFDTPHMLAMDSAGRLFVADRVNNRIQIFTQDGKLITEWKQFGRPSGFYITGDRLYAIDADSTEATHPGGWKKGVWIGSISQAKADAFVPDEQAGEGVVVGPDGNMYGAVNVAPRGITRYSKQAASKEKRS
jgi:hypothetical protein